MPRFAPSAVMRRSESPPTLPRAAARAAPPAPPTARMERRTRRPRPRWRAPAGPRHCGAGRPASNTPDRRQGSWSSLPWPVSPSIWIVQLPIPRMARSRRQPRSWSASNRSTRPLATSRAARTNAIDLPADKSSDSSLAGACAASTAAAGASRISLHGHRRPSRAISRRWIAAARLELDQLLADRPGQRLERLGLPPDPQPRIRTDRAPDQRIEPEPLVERLDVLVDAERRAASARSPTRPPRRSAARAPNTTRSRDGCATRTSTGCEADVNEPVQHSASHADQAVEAVAERQCEHPAGPNLDADLDPGAAARASISLLADHVHVDQERPRRRRSAAGRPRAGSRSFRPRASLRARAPLDQSDRGGAGDEPRRGRRGRLDRGQRRRAQSARLSGPRRAPGGRRRPPRPGRPRSGSAPSEAATSGACSSAKGSVMPATW